MHKSVLKSNCLNKQSTGYSFLSLVEKDLCKVQKLIDECLIDSDTAVRFYVEHVKKSKGKMFRPALLLLTAKNFGKISRKHIIAAAAIELIHQASLLHDDVIDDGQMRRNLPTANKLFGNEAAVLIGDFLLGKVVKICCGLEKGAIEKIADCAITTCRGELMQISQRSNWNLTEQQYIKIISEKSASLFAASCYLGALLSGADEKVSQNFSKYGQNLGIAFQIKDDLLDIIASQNYSGKTSGRDLEKKNVTLPLLHLLKNLKRKDKAILQNLKSNRNKLIKMMSENGSVKYSLEKSQDFLKSALKNIESIKDKKIKTALTQAAEFAINRSN
jgi:octaprenyl-diphosphate synthase